MRPRTKKKRSEPRADWRAGRTPPRAAVRHFLTIEDVSREDLWRILEVSFRLRYQREAKVRHEPVLAGKTLAMIFEKPSLRTRVSFEQAMIELGGHAIVLSRDEVGLGKRESAADVARVLSGMVHGIMARVFEHAKLEDMAAHADVPVVNALSDYVHPCQALADAMTIIDEFGDHLDNRTIAFIGDGNNVARSLAALAGRLGMHFTLACPPGYELDQPFLDRLARECPAMRMLTTGDASAAVRQADVIVTDTWVSMGQEAEMESRRRAFAGFQVDQALVDAAPEHAIVLHCLPAYRGYEITSDVIDGPRSRVFAEAHNRLHAQKGLLAVLLGGA